jgi:hypothetical protein
MMSIYFSPDESPGAMVSSNKGWGDFCRWVETLGDEFDELHRLCEHGWNEPVSDVIQQLKSAAQSNPPDDQNITSTIADILEVLSTFNPDDPVVVTNGMGISDSAE